MKTTQTAIAQRSQQKLYFDHQDMDYYFAWILGRHIYDGSKVEKCFNPRDIGRRMVKAGEYFLFGKVKLSKIQCPTLCLAGEGEAQITLDIARECYEQLPNSLNKLVIFTLKEGGEAHCQIDNPALPNQVMFD